MELLYDVLLNSYFNIIIEFVWGNLSHLGVNTLKLLTNSQKCKVIKIVMCKNYIGFFGGDIMARLYEIGFDHIYLN